MKDELTKLLQMIFDDLGAGPDGIGAGDVAVELTVPENSAHGDYSTPTALKFAKILKKSPMEVALQVAEQVKGQKLEVKSEGQNQNIHQSVQKVSSNSSVLNILQAIEKVEVAPPGFINIFLTEVSLVTQLGRVLEEKEAYGTSKSKLGKKAMVEFTDPNPFKEFHVGHLYSNAVGESLSRLYEARGWEVKRADYFGDVGMHVAKSLWGMMKLMANPTNPTNLTNLEQKTLNNRIKFLGQAYAMGATAYEEDEAAKAEMVKLNKLIFVAAQQYFGATYGTQAIVDYRQGKTIDELQLATVKELYQKGREWSLAYFETIYTRLGTTFDYYYPEGIVGEYGMKLVHEHVADGVFEKSDGAIIFRGEAEGLHTRVFINSLGLPTYEAKELGLNYKKYEDFPFDLSLIVTGNEINEYFKVLMAAMGKVIPDVAKKTKHLGHGMVRLPTGKMSSRTGKVLTGDWLLEETKKRVYDLLEKSESKYTKEQTETIAEKAAVAAVKYSLLKVSLPTNISFDMETSVSFDGDSGPYLQYTYARCRSVLRKAHVLSSSGLFTLGSVAGTRGSALFNADSRIRENDMKLNPEERSVARSLMYFSDVVTEAAQNFAPNTLCTYLFNVAQAYNLFYAKHSILGSAEKPSTQAETSFRLALTTATAQVLKNGLYLLGIEVLEQM